MKKLIAAVLFAFTLSVAIVRKDASPASAAERLSSMEVFPDLTCKAGVHQQFGVNVAGHTITYTGKGGPFEVFEDGTMSNDVDNCASDDDAYGYVLIEIYPPVIDVYFDTEYDFQAVISCWTSYATMGSPRGRIQTGPSFFDIGPYAGSTTFPLGYGPTSPVQYGIAACWVEGEARFRFGFSADEIGGVPRK